MDRVRQLWGQGVAAVRALEVDRRVQQLLDQARDNPLVWGAVALALLLVVWMVILLLRRRPAEQRDDSQYLEGEDFKQKRKVRKSIEKTLQELQRDDPQFVSLMHSILKHRSIDQLLSHDEIEVALGRLSYLQEKRRTTPKKRSSLLALAESSHDTKEKQAAMLTVVRSCYASDDIYSVLDDTGRRLIDRFLDSL